MVADTGPDMLFPSLTWAYAAAAATDPGSYKARASNGCPADTGRRRLLAALCAKYVPKF